MHGYIFGSMRNDDMHKSGSVQVLVASTTITKCISDQLRTATKFGWRLELREDLLMSNVVHSVQWTFESQDPYDQDHWVAYTEMVQQMGSGSLSKLLMCMNSQEERSAGTQPRGSSAYPCDR
eukprot:1627930-Amphidinium_carterae.1